MLFVFWSSAQVKETNFLPAKEQLKTAIARCRTEGDIQSTKSLTNIEKVSLEFDFAFGSDQARIILLEVLEFREFVRHGSKAGLIAIAGTEAGVPRGAARCCNNFGIHRSVLGNGPDPATPWSG